MATRAKLICRHAGCSKAIEAPGYCERHKKESIGWNRSHGDKSSADRGYGYQWQKKRELILRRDCGLCQIKGSECRIIAKEVDHKINKERAKAMGWPDDQIDDESNLQSACVPCHKAKTERERQHRRGSLKGHA